MAEQVNQDSILSVELTASLVRTKSEKSEKLNQLVGTSDYSGKSNKKLIDKKKVDDIPVYEVQSDEENPRNTFKSDFTEIQKIRNQENWGSKTSKVQEYGVVLIEEKVCEISLANAPVNQRRWF